MAMTAGILTIVIFCLSLPGSGDPAAATSRPAPVSALKSDETITFFPTLACQTGLDGAWRVLIHGWVYEANVNPTAMSTLQAALNLDRDSSDDDEDERDGDEASEAADEDDAREFAFFVRRAGPFLADSERGKRIAVRLGDASYVLPESGKDGHFRGSLTIDAGQMERLTAKGARNRLQYTAILPDRDKRRFAGHIHVASPRGLSIVSDVDDTIKISHVRDREALLRNTFLREFREVAGMPELLSAWAAGGNAQFHYVSASPWQLYDALEEFRQRCGLPAGTFHLKHFRWTDRSFFNLFKKADLLKREAIGELLLAFPQRRFVLVGDSGERDPEIYGIIARAHPDRIARIFIRNASGQGPEDSRYADAFRDVPCEKWTVFDDPAALRGALAELDVP
jgi:phosphatidate phosphatase APP1